VNIEASRRSQSVRPFERLSQRGQVRRLTRVARNAVSAYNLDQIRLHPVHHFLNTVFRVDASLGGKIGHYALRIHRPDYQNRRFVESELTWLQALRRETSLSVPEPIPTNGGRLVTSVHCEGVPGERLCVLFRWLDGRRPPVHMGFAFYRCLGNLLGTLHRHSQRLHGYPDFVRERWDLMGLCGRSVGVSPEAGIARMAANHQRLLKEAVAFIDYAMCRLGEDRAVFGLIHSDVCRHNLLLHNRQVHVIDFDGCGWGYFAYDIAVPLAEIADPLERRAAAIAIVAGYRDERQLSDEEVSQLDAFICARLMVHAIWFASHIDEPMFGARNPLLLDQLLNRLDAVLQDH
jgi:Ser/Thr protein kinase RdoA (MazF antagonist)